MDPLTMAAIQTGMGVAGNMLSQGDRDRAATLQRQMLKEYQNLQIPDIEKQKLDLFLKESAGNFTPEELLQESQRNDYLDNIQADPRLRQARMNQLGLLEEMSKTGMTPAEQAQANKLQRMQAAEAQSKIADIERQAAQTGMKSSGASLLAKLQAAQSARNAASGDKDALLAQMSNRRLSASEGAGNLAGGLEETDYGRLVDKAKNKMGIDQFNLQNQNAARQQNWASRNAASLRNLDLKQRLGETNVDTRNQQQQYNKELQQQQYENRLKRLAGMSGASGSAAQSYQDSADRTAGMLTGIGQGAAQGYGAYNQNKLDNRKMELDERKQAFAEYNALNNKK